MKKTSLFFLGLLGLAEGLFADRAFAAELLLLDATTGKGVTGVVRVAPVAATIAPLTDSIDRALAERGRSQQIDVRGFVEISEPTAVRIEAEAYLPLRVIWRPGAELRSRTVLMQRLEPLDLSQAEAADQLLLSGWVSDKHSRLGVAGAVISVSHSAIQARSDASGYYELLVPAPEVPVVGIAAQMPSPIDVRIDAEGHPSLMIRDRLFAAGGARLNAVLGELDIRPGGHRQRQSLISGPLPPASNAASAALLRLEQGDAPPSSITVGFADASCTQRCCTGSCPNSCTMSLEDYVRRGLPKEWIASWNFDALAAGAVAYRSYGAWHVFNPPQSAYDVCSSACCQVNEPGTQSNSNVAAAATAGLMLKRDGGIFRSEYSAQNNNLQGSLSCVNNDLSCGNGSAGSPNTGWPCLADPVSVDQACFGHGRGMSQWGNQYWTQAIPAQAWKWQLNHYYNDSGNGTGLRTAEISQALVIDALRVLPSATGSGATITLELEVRNLAASTHEHVMIGGSLRQAPGPFIDDSINDQPVSLPPGASTVSRQFVLPDDLPDGTYDVYASLYLDVDRNQSISSRDLVQQLVIEVGALTINAGLFADRFESPLR